jgi:hypothetical protein
MGAIGSSACSLTTKSQTNVVLSVRSACFVTQEQHAPCSRLMLMSSAIGKASRRIAGVLGDMRSIAPILLLTWPGEASRPLVSLGAPVLFLTVLPVCGRRNECSGSLLHL